MLTKDIRFYKSILSIAIPVALQNLINFSVNLIDTLMIGSLGENSLSGVNLAGQLFFISMIINMGICEGGNILISQFYGKGDIPSIRKIYPIVYRLGSFVAFIAFVIGFFFPEEFLSIYANSNDTAVISEGAKYLRIISLTYIPNAITSCNIRSLRAVQSAHIAMYIYGSSLFINATLNYLLIFGNWGFPELGVQGAAIATLVARLVELTISLVYLFKYDKKIQLKFSDLKKVEKKILKPFVIAASPVVINEIFWVLGTSSIAIIFGKLGKDMVSANAINSVLSQLVSLFLMGVGSASLTIIGQTIGSGELKKAYRYGQSFLVIGLAMGCISACIIYFSRDAFISLYNLSPETIVVAQELLAASAVMTIFQSSTSISGMGVLRGGGDGKYILFTEIIFVWLFALPLGFLAAFVFELPVFWIFIFTRFDGVLKSIFYTIRILKGQWARDLTITS